MSKEGLMNGVKAFEGPYVIREKDRNFVLDFKH